MEPVLGKDKASDFVSKDDVISNMPQDVITNILNRLPTRYAVRTSILARNWRFKWNMLSQLVFELGSDGKSNYNEKDISRILLHLKGVITKFVLYIAINQPLNVEDIGHWLLFLSRKGIKEFTLINNHLTLLKLPTHLFSCIELEHLKLENCCLHDVGHIFRCFPNLSTLDLRLVTFECGNNPVCKMKPMEIAKLEKLTTLYFPLCVLDNIAITSSIIFQLSGFLPKLQMLVLDLEMCKFLAEAHARKRVPTSFLSLKDLVLHRIDFSSDIMLSFVLEMICGSPNLQDLGIIATYDPPPALRSSLKVDYSTMRQLQLQNVTFV